MQYHKPFYWFVCKRQNMTQSFYKYPASGMSFFRKIFIGIIFLFTIISLSPNRRIEAQDSGIQGLVFRDFNANGRFESKPGSYQEVGVPGIVVTAYDDAGNSVATANSDANGAYQLALPAGNYRVAFSGYGNGDFSGVQGEDSGSSVQFVTAPAEAINFAINYPDHYCQANPEICSPVYVNGDPLQTGTTSSSTSFVSFRYDGTDIPQAPDADAKGNQTGPLWGIAFQTNTRNLYAATFIRRHVGIGPLGEGGIYRLSYNSASLDAAPTVSAWLDAKTLGIDTGLMGTGATPADRNLSRGLNPIKSLATTDVERDLQAYAGVGKVGFGGLDISEDNDTLWLVNLNQRTLNSITIDSDNNPATLPTSADVGIFNIPNPACSNGEARPFAVKAYRGKIYVGVVCDASASQNAQDLKAVVLEFDGNSFSTIFSMPLNYARQNGPDYLKGSCTEPTNWRAWTTSVIEPCVILGYYIYPQPILSAIEFDIDGSLMLGFMDRGSQQFGYKNNPPKALPFSTYEYYGNSTGDTIRVCRVNNAYVLEGQSGCEQHLDENYPYNANAGGNSGIAEYYHEDILRSHLETSLGGVAFFAGSGEVVTTAINPYNTIANAGGVNWFSNQTGLSRPTGYVVYEGGNDQSGNFSKAGGLGDIDILCENAPVEIGNRVWLDLDKDGLQDASEPPISGVRVQLVQAGAVIATVVTNDNGNYIFSSATGTDSDSFHYGLNLKRGESYEVRIPIDSQSTIGKPLYQIKLTTANADQITNNIEGLDRIDSDGILVGGSADVQVQIGNSGQNNHTYDFGFITQELTATPTTTGTATLASAVTFTSTPISTTPATNTASPTTTGTATLASAVTFTSTPISTTPATNTATPTTTGTATLALAGTFTSTPISTTPAANTATPNTTGTATLVSAGTFTSTPISTTPAANTATPNTTGTATLASTGTFTSTPISTTPATPTHTPTSAPNSFSIGSFVWFDANQNGLQDVGELPIAGADVALFVLDNAGNWVQARDIAGQLLSNQLTTDTGLYSFQNLPAGSYVVQVTPPNGYLPTPINSNADNDIANDSNIVSSNGASGYFSPMVILSANNEISESGGYAGDNQDDGADTFGNMTLDFGFIQAQSTFTPPPTSTATLSTTLVTHTATTTVVPTTLTATLTLTRANTTNLPSTTPTATPICTAQATQTPNNQGTLTPNATASGTVTATVATPCTPTVTATPSYTFTPIATESGSTQSPRQGTQTATPTSPVYDLALVKTLANGQTSSVASGSIVNFVLKIRNQGNVASNDFTFIDSIPAGMQFVAYTGSLPADSSCAGNAQAVTFACVISNLKAGETLEIVLQLKVIDESKAPFRNWAEITADSASDYNTKDKDSAPDFNTGTDNSTGSGTAPNDNVVNHNDILADSDSGDEDDNDFEEINVSGSNTLLATATAIPTSTIAPTIAGVTNVPTLGNQPTISKVSQQAVAKPNDFVSWVITVRNPTSAAIGPLIVSDTLDSRLSYISSTATSGNVSVNGQQVTVSVVSLGAGETMTIVLQTKVSASAVTPAVIYNTASLVVASGTPINSNTPAVNIIPSTLPLTGSNSPARITILLAGVFSMGLAWASWRKHNRLARPRFNK
jgi:uncharacterized repeat protein (TIGR01451 family)